MCIRLNSAEKYCEVTLDIMVVLQNAKSSFQMKLILILAGLQTSKIVVFGAQKTRTHTLESRRTQNESPFDVDFGPEA